jgi:hypothetical protein
MSKEQKTNGDGGNRNNGYRPITEGYTPSKESKGGYTPKASQQSLPAAPKGGTGAAGGAVNTGGKK